MNNILTFTLFILSTKEIYGKLYLVTTNGTEKDKTHKGIEDDLATDIVFDDWDDKGKGGADYAAAPVRNYQEGSDVKLKCPSPIDFQDCQFKAPSGKIHKLGISGNPYKSGRVRNLHGVEKFNPKRLCAILVNNLQKEDNGGWSCTLKYPAGSRTATQNVKVIPAQFATVRSFSHPGELQLKKNNLLATLSSVWEEYYVSFEMWIDKNTPGDWTNVLHLTNGGNIGKHGDRVPAFFLYRNTQLHVASSVNGNSNYHINQNGFKLKKWYRIEVQQVYKGGKFHYQIKLDGKLIHNTVNTKASSFKNVRVYASDNWYPAVNGKIRNLVVSEKGECKLHGWRRYPGSGTHVTDGPAGVFLANMHQSLYKKTKAPKHWAVIGGKLKVISAGKKAIWGTSIKDEIFVDKTGTGTKWVKVPGGLQQVSVSPQDDEVVWGTSKFQHIFRWNKNKWERIPGKLKQVTVGEAGVWGVNAGGAIFYRDGTFGGAQSAGTNWRLIPGGLKWISSGVAGHVWGVNHLDQIYRRLGVTKKHPFGVDWQGVGGSIKQLDVHDDEVWGVTKDRHIYVQKIEC